MQGQLKNAMEEVKKPFPKEEELNQKLKRLSELNALLNMDEKETVMEEEQDEEMPVACTAKNSFKSLKSMVWGFII